MTQLRAIFESARVAALIDLAIAKAMPEKGLLCKPLFIDDAQRRLRRAEAALSSPSIDKPAVLRFRRPAPGRKDETLRVICVRWGTKFGDNYVNALRAGVKRNLTIPHTFECAEMELGLPGFWNKLGLFRPGFITGPTLYLDLDVVVMGNLDWALEAAKAAPISMPWVHGKYDTYTPHAAVMTFSGADVSKAWPPSDALMESFQDDERYLPIEFADVIGRLPEGKVISYKWGVLLRDEAKGASLVSFHGFPKPHQITGEPLLTRHWDVLR